MLTAERHRKILGIIEREGSAKVAELARAFGVTQETIRRDLERLETEGKLLRRRGGAITLSSMRHEVSFAERQIINAPQKAAIAAEAIKRVQPEDTILLDDSTTAWQMARLLPDFHLTVITNALKVAAELAQRPHVTCICLGGTLAPELLSFVGPVSERTLRDYHADKAFLSCKGFDLERGCTDPNDWLAMLKRSMLSVSDRHFLLADHSKFGVRSLTVFASLGDFDELITDDGLADKSVEALTAHGLFVTRTKAAA